MQGKILDYNSEFKSGLIRGEDGNKYRFSIDDVKSAIVPKAGADVDFESNGDKAVEVYVLDQKTDQANTIKSEPRLTINPETQKNIIQTVKKIVIWVGIGFVLFMIIMLLVPFIQVKIQNSKISVLRNECSNNNSKACYELGIFEKEYIGPFINDLSIDEQSEALAKGCKLGNKDACREGGYYKEGCELQDGESCYVIAQQIDERGSRVMCNYDPGSSWCERNKKEQNEIKEYNRKACDYGYSQGCLK